MFDLTLFRKQALRNSLPIMALLVTLVMSSAWARSTKAPTLTGPDERYKTDLLVVVAHPDDESGYIAGYLARVIYDQHRRVAVIFMNRGQDGRNLAGLETGNALGAEREIEGRRALASLGVVNVWFLGTPNVSSQNVLIPLERWGHGSVLEEVVRLIRLTRPEVILTWLPAYVAGENHADHQAASVIANEAFDLAGDPAVFSEQLVPEGEGLAPWQPEKIYYFSDAFDYPDYGDKPQLPSPYRKSLAEAQQGPVYSNAEVSPTQHIAYSRSAALETSFYLTQGGEEAVEAIEKKDFKKFERPAPLIFGKSLVGGTTTGDVFEGIVPGPIPFQRLTRHGTQKQAGISLELGGPWCFYRQFWKAHNIEHLAELLPVPETAVPAGFGDLRLPLLVRNNTDRPQEVTVSALLPEGWSDKTRYRIYSLSPGQVYAVRAVLAPADTDKPAWHEITWQAQANAQQTSVATLRVFTGAVGAAPQ